MGANVWLSFIPRVTADMKANGELEAIEDPADAPVISARFLQSPYLDSIRESIYPTL
jgi:hypothetical protein